MPPSSGRSQAATGWRSKRWQTRKGQIRGGNLFTKTTLHHLLSNVVYLGKVRYKKEVHSGEHEAIVERAVWQKVQELLHRRRASWSGSAPARS
jgi:site-specific DNA recombinase